MKQRGVKHDHDIRGGAATVNRAKRKGTDFEVAVVAYLNEHGYPDAERRVTAGAQDKGDISGVRNTVIEAKSLAKITLASAVDEMLKEQINAKAQWGVTFFKRTRKGTASGYAVTTIEQYIALLSAARCSNID